MQAQSFAHACETHAQSFAKSFALFPRVVFFALRPIFQAHFWPIYWTYLHFQAAKRFY
jgi:hypothetical protein